MWTLQQWETVIGKLESNPALVLPLYNDGTTLVADGQKFYADGQKFVADAQTLLGQVAPPAAPSAAQIAFVTPEHKARITKLESNAAIGGGKLLSILQWIAANWGTITGVIGTIGGLLLKPAPTT
jgi:hypothetical protein